MVISHLAEYSADILQIYFIFQRMQEYKGNTVLLRIIGNSCSFPERIQCFPVFFHISNVSGDIKEHRTNTLLHYIIYGWFVS